MTIYDPIVNTPVSTGCGRSSLKIKFTRWHPVEDKARPILKRFLYKTLSKI